MVFSLLMRLFTLFCLSACGASVASLCFFWFTVFVPSLSFAMLLVALVPLAAEVSFLSQLSLLLSAVECFSNSFG